MTVDASISSSPPLNLTLNQTGDVIGFGSVDRNPVIHGSSTFSENSSDISDGDSVPEKWHFHSVPGSKNWKDE